MFCSFIFINQVEQLVLVQLQMLLIVLAGKLVLVDKVDEFIKLIITNDEINQVILLSVNFKTNS
jgi:hypothetical protein